LSKREKLVIIMRKPCIQEDEGRHFIERQDLTKKEAEKWIADQVGEYFGPQAFYIVEPK